MTYLICWKKISNISIETHGTCLQKISVKGIGHKMELQHIDPLDPAEFTQSIVNDITGC